MRSSREKVEVALRRHAPELPCQAKKPGRRPYPVCGTLRSGRAAFASCAEAIATSSEVASRVGVRLPVDDDPLVVAPDGLDDLIMLREGAARKTDATEPANCHV